MQNGRLFVSFPFEIEEGIIISYSGSESNLVIPSEYEEEAIKWYKRVIEEGTDYVPRAMYNIGMIYYDRNKSDHDIDECLLKQNQKEAYKWIDLSAQTGGDPDVLFQRGFMLENGIGVERNAEEARASYEMAEYNGSEEAKIKLASFDTD